MEILESVGFDFRHCFHAFAMGRPAGDFREGLTAGRGAAEPQLKRVAAKER